MRGTLSPILSHLVQTTIAAVGEKEKLNRLINKYRKMLRFAEGGFNVSEIRFGLADLLITRDEPNDWKEARQHYDFVLEHATYGYLRSAAMVGKAELAVRAAEAAEIEAAIVLCQRAYKNLCSLVGQSDFYSIKSLIVEAELHLKRDNKTDKGMAMKLFEKVFSDDIADPYFKARAIVGHAETLMNDKKVNVNRELQLCYEAIDLLKDRPDDYFSVKARLIQGEYISRRMMRYDKSRATGIFMGIIGNKNADPDLAARARLNLAEISPTARAKSLVKDVITASGIDPYLQKRAKEIGKGLKKAK